MKSVPLKRILSLLLPLGVFAYLFYVLGRNAAQIEFGWDTAGALVLATVLCWLNVGVSFLMWYRILSVQQPLGLSAGYEVYCASVLAKYLPAGKFLQFAPFLYYFKTKEERTRAFVAAFLVNALGMVGGLIVAVPGALGEISALQSHTLSVVGLATVGFLAVALRPRFFFQPLRWIRLGHVAEQIPASLPAGQVASVLAINIVGWLLLAGAQWVLIRPLAPELSFNVLWYILTAYYAASWVGYLSVIFPSGIGATEATLFVLFQRKGLAAATSATVPLLFRFALITADLLFVLPLWKTLLHRRPEATEASPKSVING